MPRTPHPPRKPALADAARWLSDLHCLWRFCGRRACVRAQACRGSLAHCLPFIALVPPEASDFIRHWDDALREGLSFEDMMDEHAEPWDALMRWRERVAGTQSRPAPLHRGG